MRTTKMKELAKKYFDNIKAGLDAVSLEKIEQVSSILYRAYTAGKKIILMGNGGSAAAASHFACDLAKGASVAEKKRFRAFALCDNIPMVTAYGNDCGYEYIFSEQLKNFLEKDDVVIAISGSGNSKNVLNAILYANNQSAITIGITGFQGGKLKELACECLIVPSNNMEQIEDIHLIILHTLKLFLRSMIEADEDSQKE